MRAKEETFSQMTKEKELLLSSGKTACVHEITVAPFKAGSLDRKIDGHPFVPSCAGEREKRCEEISKMQAFA